jgi:threonine dehydratase
MTITMEDVRQALVRIAPLAQRTPVMTSRTFNRMTSVEACFKCENFQRGGAFKIRGAANAVLSLDPAVRARGVVAYSSGNHAQAVAIAAAHCGIPATIVMPDDAPKAKVEATRGYGASVLQYDRQREDRAAIGARIARETGATLVPPFDHPHVIAGQGTVALEFLEQVPDLDALAICISGGGLIAGCATAAKALRPGIHVFGVEPAGANDTYLSLQAGKRIEIPPPATIADGLRVQCPGELTFPIMQRLLDSVVLVSDDEIRDAMRFLLLRMKLVVEPSGAAAAAAVLRGRLPKGLGRVGIVISGGNVDSELLCTAITSSTPAGSRKQSAL